MLVGHHILRILSLFLQEPPQTHADSNSTKAMISSRVRLFACYAVVLIGVFGGLVYVTVHSNQGSVPDIMTTQYLTVEALPFQEIWTRKILKALVS
jgi:hypothetical protein